MLNKLDADDVWISGPLHEDATAIKPTDVEFVRPNSLILFSHR